MRGRPREYANRYSLTVSVEKDLWDYAQSYGILARDAISYGLQGLIESEIIRTKKATPEEIDRYLEIKNRELQYIITVRDTEKRALDEINKIRDEVRQTHNNKSDSHPEINWETIPDDQKIRVYTEQAFTRDERKHWINKYLTASDDERPDVLKQFSDEYVTRFRADSNRPFNKLDLGVIKRVLVDWAEAEGGF